MTNIPEYPTMILALLLAALPALPQETPEPAAVVEETAQDEELYGVDTIETSLGKLAVTNLTRSDVMNMTYDDLIGLPFEVLMLLADKLEISVEELWRSYVAPAHRFMAERPNWR